MAKTQTITFSKTGLTTAELLTVLNDFSDFNSYNLHMATLEGQYSNAWSESTDTVEIVRTWSVDSDFDAYQSETSTWDTAFRSYLSSAGITVTENIV
jgi:hypothetical protein